MAFTTLLNAIFGLDKPITGATGIALRDNVVATANGDPGAPRVKGVALSAFVGLYAPAFAVPVTITGLARHKTLRVDYARVGMSNASIFVAYSSDNGASFGVAQAVCLTIPPDSGHFRLDLVTGAGRYATSAAAGPVVHTVPANCNAIQFSISADSVELDVYCLAGVP